MKLSTETPSKAFCEKRIVEQEQYLSDLYERKASMEFDRYMELMYSALNRKDYFYSILNEHYRPGKDK